MKNIVKMNNTNHHSKYWPELLAIFEEHFEKGEKCQCGRKLPCRSKAIVMIAKVEILLRNDDTDMLRHNQHIKWAKEMKESFPDILSKFEVLEIIRIWEEYSESFAAGWLCDKNEEEVKRIFGEAKLKCGKMEKPKTTTSNYGKIVSWWIRSDLKPLNWHNKKSGTFREREERSEKI